MDHEEVQAKHGAIKAKWWKPEWDEMEEPEKFKDPEYTTMLYEMSKLNYDFAVETYEKAKGSMHEELMAETVKHMKGILDSFQKVEE